MARKLKGIDLRLAEFAGKLHTKRQIVDFMFAGNAYFTIKNTETTNRFTFRVVRFEDEEQGKIMHFVHVMTGSDNSSSYTFLGTIFDTSFFSHSKKSKILKQDVEYKAFLWLWNTLRKPTAQIPSNVEIWHEGVCGCCGRRLTVPESITRGLGPVCAERVNDFYTTDVSKHWENLLITDSKTFFEL